MKDFPQGKVTTKFDQSQAPTVCEAQAMEGQKLPNVAYNSLKILALGRVSRPQVNL